MRIDTTIVCEMWIMCKKSVSLFERKEISYRFWLYICNFHPYLVSSWKVSCAISLVMANSRESLADRLVNKCESRRVLIRHLNACTGEGSLRCALEASKLTA